MIPFTHLRQVSLANAVFVRQVSLANAVLVRLASVAIAVLVMLGFSASTAAALGVTTHAPTSYDLGVAADADIIVTFDQSLDAGSIDAASVIVLGHMSGLHAATLAVGANILTIDPDDDFMPGEMVTVNLTNAIAEQGGATALNFGYVLQFTIDTPTGSLSFQELDRWSTLPAEVPYFLFGGDLDGNGTPDAATPNEDTNDVAVFLNAGDGILDAHISYGVGGVPSSCYGGDFNLDGAIDLATADISGASMTVLLNNGNGTFAPGTTYPLGATTRQVYGGDFDGDGDIDLVTTGFSNDTLTLHTNNGSGVYSQTTLTGANGVTDGPFPVFVGDLNNDGLLDIVAGFQGFPRQIKVWLNSGGGVFSPGVSVAANAGAWDLIGNDMNGDGNLDIVLAEAQLGRFHVFLGNGSGGFASDFSVSTGSFPLGVHVADLDGDDDMEVVTSNFSSRDIRVHENDGTQNFPLAQDINLIQSGSFAWAHDLDADGDLDLTVIDELADFIFVYLNNGATGVDPAESPALRLSLRPPFPNPTSGQVTLRYDVPEGMGTVSIGIYDAGGRLVRELEDVRLDTGSGRSIWDLRAENGHRVPAGMYFLRLSGEAEEVSSRVLIVR